MILSFFSQEKLRHTKDEHTIDEIVEVLRRIRMRVSSESEGDSGEIGERRSQMETPQ